MKYFILFFDKSIKEITENDYSAIIESAMNDAPSFSLDGNLIKHSAYQQILNETEFYKQYPNYKPVVYEDKFKKYESIERKISNNTNWIKGMIKGIEQHIAEQGGVEYASRKSLDLLTQWQKKLELNK